MSTRLTVKEFVVDPSPQGRTNLVLRSDASWPTFLNNNAVWRDYSNTTVTYTISRYYIPNTSGTHTLQASCDDSFSWAITGGTFTGEQVLAGSNPQSTSSDTVTFVAGTQYLLSWQVTNTSGAAGLAATVTAPVGGNNFNLKDNLTVTAIPSGRYQAVLPYAATITAHIWGGAGGGGGNDASVSGGVGSPGLYNTLTFTTTSGDTLEVVVGEGGKGGPGNQPSGQSPGGAAGDARTNISSNSTLSLNGGTGGRSGVSGASGTGGGGGGASVVLLNNTPILIAGGGGGGGGAGVFPATDPNASIGNNVIGATPSDYRGMNGQDKGQTDGGGGGAGGGGYPGGTGGSGNTLTFSRPSREGPIPTGSIPDVPANPGKTGGNLPANSASTGVGTLYYKSGFAGGGARGGGNGQNGLIVLEIAPVGLFSTRVSGNWKQVTDAFVKVSGAWKSINDVQVKVDGTWRKVEDAGQTQGALAAVSGEYGTVVRAYSS
jgi:hypothetical protein